MTNRRIALVTGASSGFGLLTAAHLAQKGFRVFGTSRRLGTLGAPGVEMLVLDVQSDQSVLACVDDILTRAGRIDLLINNAGREHASVIEETSLEEAADVFETNFWGAVRMTRAVLPHMRRRRSGQLINVSSLAGLMGVAGQGFYAASKFALEGYTETLRLEVISFNIHVSLVEPGFFKTDLYRSVAAASHTLEDYGALQQAVELSVKRAIMRGANPERVAEAIVGIAETTSPRLRYRVGRDAVWVPRLRMLIPEWLFQLGMKRRFALP